MPNYRLTETDPAGRRRDEAFDAPNDRIALKRIADEARGVRYELWREGRLIKEGRPKRV